jgi:XTP/dITP diphosphohydrolase
LLLATRNAGKVEEIRLALSGLDVEVKSILDMDGLPDIEEDERTLEGNAKLKAEGLYRATSVPTLSDDTGLEVHCLGGAPGVLSARFAGEPSDPAANRALLLDRMRDVTNRTAQFRTSIAFTDETGTHHFDGICRGAITREERGTGGFGYDALFEPSGFDETFAELDTETKNAISHRGEALRRFVAFIVKHWSLEARR